VSIQKAWTRHYQIEWENRAADTRLPLWLRIACLAYGRHEANGHANFTRGQLSWILGTPPHGDQPFKRVDKYTVRDTIKLAVRHGWLAEGSCAECLIVPAHAIEGPQGNPAKPCPVHERKLARKQKTRLRSVSLTTRLIEDLEGRDQIRRSQRFWWGLSTHLVGI
jgi:hypothetical protein